MIFFDKVRVLIFANQNSSFYVFGVFVDSRGRWYPDKRVPDGFFDKVCGLIFASQNTVRSMFLEFLYIVRGTSGKRVPEGFFDKVCVLIFATHNRVCSMFFEFLEIVERGLY